MQYHHKAIYVKMEFYTKKMEIATKEVYLME